MQQWLLRNNLCTRYARVFWIFRKRIILSRFYFNGRHFNSTMQCLEPCWALPKLCTMWSVSSHEGTCRCNTSLGHVPATFSCVCKYGDFVPTTGYTSLPLSPQCVLHTFFSMPRVAATWPLVSSHLYSLKQSSLSSVICSMCDLSK